MKKFLLYLFLITALVLPTGVAFAAWGMDIVVTENGTASHDMLGCNITANIDYMEADGFIGDNGTDTLVKQAGAPKPHMLVGDKIMFAIPVAGNSTNVLSFTTGNDELDSFYIIPGYDGYVTVADNTTLELGDNFTITQSGWIDTDAGVDKNLVFKEHAFRTYVSENVTDNITSAILDITDPSGVAAAAWTNPDRAINGDIGDFANTTGNVAAGTWSPVLEATYAAGIEVMDIRMYTDEMAGATWTLVDIDIEYGAAWHPLYVGAFTDATWLEVPVSPPRTITNARVSFYNADVAGHTARLYVVEFVEILASVSATGVERGEHTVTTIADGTFFYVERDDITWENYAPIKDGLVFNAPLWHSEFDESPFTTKDVNEVACTVTGATWSSDGYGFDGNDDIDLVNALTGVLSGDAVGTIIVWRKPDDAIGGGGEPIVSFGDTDALEFLELQNENDGKLLSQVYVAGAAKWVIRTDNPVFADNAWAMVSLVQNGVSPIAYINGDAPDQAFTTSTDRTIWFSGMAGLDNGYIAAREINGTGIGSYMEGTVGSLLIYDWDLDPAEIEEIYNATKWKYEGADEYFHYNLVGAGVLDNDNDWTFCKSNVMPYSDNTSISVNGTLQLWFQPIDIISDNGTHAYLPDRAGGDNPGLFIWGSNPSGVSIALGAMASDYTATAAPPLVTPDVVPILTPPVTTGDAAKLAGLAAHPLTPAIHAISEVTGIYELLWWWFGTLVLALLLFGVTYKWLKNLMISGALFCALIAYGVTIGIYDFWVIFAIIVILLGCVVLQNRRGVA